MPGLQVSKKTSKIRQRKKLMSGLMNSLIQDQINMNSLLMVALGVLIVAIIALLLVVFFSRKGISPVE